MAGIVLSTVRATCKECGHTVHQIDASREHAIEVVREAMQKHVAETHPQPSRRMASVPNGETW